MACDWQETKSKVIADIGLIHTSEFQPCASIVLLSGKRLKGTTEHSACTRKATVIAAKTGLAICAKSGIHDICSPDVPKIAF